MAKHIYPEMKSVGPADAKIMLIGEAPGADEQLQGRPFVGVSGEILRGMCKTAGIDFAQTYRTNVFHKRPQNNQIETFCDEGRENAIPGYPALFRGQYVNAVHAPELARLEEEILAVNPNVIVPLGNTPLWALLREPPKISATRGRTQYASIRGKQFKIVPTFHPAYIARTWKDRVIAIQDLIKARLQSEFRDIRLPSRHVLIDPTMQEVRDFFREHVDPAKIVCMDVETSHRQITVCGIATSPHVGIVVPFWDSRKESNSYWDDPKDEAECVALFRSLLANAEIEKIHQNGMYDMSYYVDNWKARCMGMSEDTMLLQHAMWPELKKGLGDLSSVHTDEAAWKMMRLKNIDSKGKDE